MSRRPTLAEVEAMQLRNRAAWSKPATCQIEQVIEPAPVETPGERVDRMARTGGRSAPSASKPRRTVRTSHSLPVPTETDECRRFIAWTKLARYRGRPLFDRVCKIPNERGKAGAAIAVLISIGMRNGFPDYFIAAPVGIWAGLLLEAKRTKGSDTTDAQLDWQRDLTEFGYCADICLGADQLIAATQRYFDAAGCTHDGSFIDPTRAHNVKSSTASKGGGNSSPATQGNPAPLSPNGGAPSSQLAGSRPAVTAAESAPGQSTVTSAPGPAEPTFPCASCQHDKPASKFTMRPGMKRRPRRCDDCVEAKGIPSR